MQRERETERLLRRDLGVRTDRVHASRAVDMRLQRARDDMDVRAVNEGYIKGPRLVISGLALSQTGGHGDMRSVLKRPSEVSNDKIGSAIARIADGISEVREAARDELRKGAHFVKIMASGGAASVTDPIENLQYSDEELRAIVEEARAWNTYVMAHPNRPHSGPKLNRGAFSIYFGLPTRNVIF